MVPEIGIWRCASGLIKHYGDEADIEAAARADEHEAKGQAIDALQKIQPGERRH